MTELLAILRENRMDSKLNEVVVKRQTYAEEKKKERKAWDELLKAKLSKEQFLALDRYLDERNSFESEYGEVAYELGLKDGVNLQKRSKI